MIKVYFWNLNLISYFLNLLFFHLLKSDLFFWSIKSHDDIFKIWKEVDHQNNLKYFFLSKYIISIQNYFSTFSFFRMQAYSEELKYLSDVNFEVKIEKYSLSMTRDSYGK